MDDAAHKEGAVFVADRYNFRARTVGRLRFFFEHAASQARGSGSQPERREEEAAGLGRAQQ
jgi:hypothetical protein